MEYLLKVQKAIAQTDTIREHPSEDHKYGWEEAAGDLEYGISCGSEHAVMQSIKSWTGPWCIESANKDQEEDGYADRMEAINELITEQEKGNE